MQDPRSLRASAIAFFALVALSQSGCFLANIDTATYYLAAPLVPIGSASGSGRVEILFAAWQHEFFFELEGLAPDTDYGVTVGGARYLTISTDAAGNGQIQTGMPAPSFDPRGRRIAVVDPDDVEVLELAAPSDPAYSEAEVAPLAAFGPGTGVVQTTTLRGQRSVAVTLRGADPGTYDVVVDGTPLAALDAPAGNGSAVIEPVLFDPRTAAIEVQRDGVGYFAGDGRARIEGLDWCSTARKQQALLATVEGSALAALVTRADCSLRFEVAVANVPMDDYEVVVGGVARGTIAVGADENGVTGGTVTFSSSESSVAPLDFDPMGAPIEVRRADQAYFALDVFAP
jgi:hypothetical protein